MTALEETATLKIIARNPEFLKRIRKAVENAYQSFTTSPIIGDETDFHQFITVVDRPPLEVN